MWLSVQNLHAFQRSNKRFFFISLKITMLQTRIVPWIDYEEFETVYNWLFSDRKTQLETIQRGIDRVNKRC